MSANTFGEIFRVSSFGESHGAALGVVIDGVPANLCLDVEAIKQALSRRRPGQSSLTTQRQESDEPEILSGVFEGKTTGAPLTILVRNQNQKSADYENIKNLFRPGHADYTYWSKFGVRDYRGGGRSSGRETLSRVAAGAVAQQVLNKYGIKIVAGVTAVHQVKATKFVADFIEQNPVRCADPDVVSAMAEAIRQAKLAQDSVGAIIECHIDNLPAGVGEPAFDKLDAKLAQAMLSIGAVKGFEVGDGFAAAASLGSQNNDAMTPDGFVSNHAGGISGGISTGQTVIFKVAVKPTPSIGLEQATVDTQNQSVHCQISGRHDPCLAPRIVPVIEAMAAITVLDLLLLQRARQID